MSEISGIGLTRFVAVKVFLQLINFILSICQRFAYLCK